MGTNPPLPVRTAATVLAAAVFLGASFVYLLWENDPGVGISTFVAVLLLSFVSATALHGKAIRTDTALLLLLVLFFAAMIGVRENMLLVVLNVASIGLLCLLIAEVHVRRNLREFNMIDYLRVAFPPIQFLDPMIKSISTVITVGSVSTAKNTTRVIRGIVIAIPVVFVFFALFAAADPTFQRFIDWIFHIQFFNTDYPAQIILGFVVALFITGAFSYALGERSTVSEMFTTHIRKLGYIEILIVLGSITAVFAAYVLVQASYLFGGADYVTSQGVTYAEYARRGFFELNAVCVLAYLALAVSELFIDREGTKHSLSFRAVSTALIVLTIATMASSLYKIILYESVYGFTTLRLYSHAFVILLALTFLSLLYKILVDIRNETFALRTFVSIVVFVAFMNLLNPDAYIARMNIDRFEHTGKIDIEYMLSLSNDALPELVRALPVLEQGTTTSLRFPLVIRRFKMTQPEPWQSSTLSDIRALKAVESL